MFFPHDAVERAITSEVGEGPLADALRALARNGRAAGGGGSLVALPTTSFVAPGGNDLTAVRGQIEAPFLTIAAAISAAVDGDSIYISPGTYAEDLTIESLNPGLTSLSLFGAGFDTLVSSISWTPAAGTYFRVADMHLTGAPEGGRSLAFDGTTSDARVFVENVALDFGALFTATTLVKLDTIMSGLNPALQGLPVSIVDCVDFFLGSDSVLYWGLELGYASGAATTLNYGTYTVEESTIHSSFPNEVATPALRITGVANVFVDVSVRLIGTTGREISFPSVDATALTTDVDNTLSPTIILGAWCDGDVDILFSPATDSTNAADLSRGKFLGNVDIGVNAPASSTTILARNATFEGNVTVGQGISFDIRESFFLQGNLSVTGTGTIDRDQHTVLASFDGGAPFQMAITFVPPFPGGLGDTDFNAVCNSLDVPVGAAGVTAFSGTGATVTFGSGTSAARITVIRTNTLFRALVR